MAHLCRDVKRERLNSRHYHCFHDEDLMGQWKLLCQQVSRESAAYIAKLPRGSHHEHHLSK